MVSLSQPELVNAVSTSWRFSKVQALLAVLVVVLCGGAGIYLKRANAAVAEQQNLFLMLQTTEDAAQSLIKMEAANRGFLLTGNSDFRAHFARHVDILSSRHHELLALTKAEPEQQEQLRRFKAKLTQWFKLYAPAVRQRRQEETLGPGMGTLTTQHLANVAKCNLLYGEMLDLLGQIQRAQEDKIW
jgi:CHASE3 domain sensor protein